MRKLNRYGFKYFSVVNNVSDNLTCVEFIRCSPERMIPITDKRITYIGSRFVDTASKLNTKGPYAAMGTGFSSNIVEIEDKWAKIPVERNLNKELKNFKEKAFYPTFLERLDEVVVNGFGLTLSEFQSGLKNGVPITGKVMDDIRYSIRSFIRGDSPTEPAFRTEMLFGGYDQKSKNMKMYVVEAPSIVNNFGQPFVIRGSGLDLGSPVLDRYFSLLPSHKRDNNSLEDILYVGLEAMIRGEGNIGVGGIPEIGLMEKDKDVIKFSEDVCGVMRNTVAKSLMGDLDSNKAKTILERLANNEISPDDAAKQISDPLDPKKYLFSR